VAAPAPMLVSGTNVKVDLKGQVFDGRGGKLLARHLQVAAAAVIARAEKSVAARTPVDRGVLRASWDGKVVQTGVLEQGVGGAFNVLVGSSQKYAPFVERGRRKGAKMPPRAAIEAWVRRKLLGKARRPGAKGARGAAGRTISAAAARGPRVRASGRREAQALRIAAVQDPRRAARRRRTVARLEAMGGVRSKAGQREVDRLTFLIRRAIAKRGIKAKWMLKYGLAAERIWIRKTFAAAVRKWSTEVSK